RPHARDDAALGHLLLDARPDLLVGGEAALARAVLDQLDGGQQALAAPDVARVRVILEYLLQPRVESRAHPGRVLPEPLALHDLDVLQSHRTARRVPGVRVRVAASGRGLPVVAGFRVL